MIAGLIHYYLNNPLLMYWFPKSDDFCTTASNFNRNSKPRWLTDHQTASIPWVQSIVIKHYILGKEVFFHGQDNYVDLYRYLEDFLAQYLMLGLCRTIGDDLPCHPEHYTYSASDHHPYRVFIHREHMDWGLPDHPQHI
jgi:hypothetical protein